MVNKTAEKYKLLNLEFYMPFYLTRIANRWTSTASRRYLDMFDVGVAEWGALMGLSTYGSITSLEIAQRIEMDAAAVSRAITRLRHNGYIVPVAGRFKGRSKPFDLTTSGKVLIQEIQMQALEHEKRLLSCLTNEETQTLMSLLKKVHGSLSQLDSS